MTTRFLASTACAFLILAGQLYADEPLKSGPQVGTKNNRRGFMPQWVTGPCAGQSLCPV